MLRKVLSVGALLSTDGTYRHMGRNALAGAEHAIAELNEGGQLDFELRLQHFNPAGKPERYSEGLAELHERGVRHVFGPITSANRKDIIPDLELRGSLLWFPCPYEGFESSESVLYLGGCPNQTLIPLLRFAIEAFGDRAMLVGSNYVWAWESNRIAREVMDVAGGAVCAEKYFHLGVTAFGEVIKGLLRNNPSFVLNNLVGESSYAFLRQLDGACVEHGVRLPVLSCNFTEGELAELGHLQALRLFSCGPYFESVDPAFSLRQRRRHGPHPYSHYYACTYAGVHLLAEGCRRSGSDAPAEVCKALYARPVKTALGHLQVSPRNNHTSLPCYIAELEGERFMIRHIEPELREADPYLTATDLSAFHTRRHVAPSRHLRIVK
jgi:branched-chain amino acid transport system substrate-binding protein